MMQLHHEHHISNVHSSKNLKVKKGKTVDGGNSFVDNMAVLGAAEQIGGDLGEEQNVISSI